MKEENRDLKKIFDKFGWISTDLNQFIEKADKKTIINKSE